jgi:protein-tyrosine phosphatase
VTRFDHDERMDDEEPDPHPRLVPLVGAFNFRDLGGYASADGRTTRWGRLFRSDTLHELTEDDLAVLRRLDLRSVIDLRTDRELGRTGRGPLADQPVGYAHLSVIREGAGEAMAAPDPEGEDLAERYLWYLDVGRHALVESLALIADADRLPLVFHCAAGKDRTGVLAALVLDILDVDAGTIVADYFLTAGRMELILGRYRSDPAFAERMAVVPASRFSVEAATMARFLGELRERFGGARAWAVGAGLDRGAFDRMEESLLETR